MIGSTANLAIAVDLMAYELNKRSSVPLTEGSLNDLDSAGCLAQESSIYLPDATVRPQDGLMI